MPPLSEENEQSGEMTLSPQESGKPQTGRPKNMRTLLSNLRKSKTIDEAEEAIKVLRDLTDDDTEATAKTASDIIMKSNFGMTLILLSLGKWYTESSKFSGTAIALLADITYSNEETKQVIVESGSLDIVMAAANKYPQDYMVRSNLLILLENITHNKDNDVFHNEVTGSERIDLVVNTMKDWPQDEDIQEAGCGYFVNIMAVEETKLELQGKKIGSLLMAAIENFQENEEVRMQAKEALDIYTSSTDKAQQHVGDDDDGEDEEEGGPDEENLLNEYDDDDEPVVHPSSSLCSG